MTFCIEQRKTSLGYDVTEKKTYDSTKQRDILFLHEQVFNTEIMYNIIFTITNSFQIRHY